MFKWTKPKNELDVDVRFLLANERTLLAWVRTGLTLIAGGVAVGFLPDRSSMVVVAGLGAVALGGILSVIGYARYQVADAAIRSGKLPSSGIGSLLVVIAVAVFAAALLITKMI